VKAGKVPAAMGAILRRLQGYREASDYTRGFVMPEPAQLQQGGWLAP